MASVATDTPVPQGNSAAKQPRIYTCSTCGRTFKRSEHCFRHERGHTNIKPYSCEFCGRQYARKDLVTRHMQSFHPSGDERRILKTAPLISPSTSDRSPRDTSTAVDELELPATAEIVHQFEEPVRGEDLTIGRQLDPALLNGANSNQSPEAPYESSHARQNLQQRLPPLDSSEGLGDNNLPDRQSPTRSDPSQTTSLSDHHPSTRASIHILQSQGSKNGIPPSTNTHVQGEAQSQVAWNSDNLFDGYGMSDGAFNLYTPQQSGDMDLFALMSSATPQMDMSFLNNQLQHENGVSHPAWDSLEGLPLELSHLRDGGPNSRSETGNTPDSEIPRTLQFIDEDMHAYLQADIQKRLPLEMRFTLPDTGKLQQFMKCYLSAFHLHLPILHLPSLVTRPIYTPLMLAILAVGALYQLRRTAAKQLWSCAQTLLERDCKRKGIQDRIPIPALQAKLLLTIMAAFGGDSSEFVGATENVGFWAAEYRLRRPILNISPEDLNNLSWADWSDRETAKRLLCGIFILSSMLAVTFDTTPFLSVTQDLDLDVPEPDQSWKASNSQQWEQVSFSRRNIKLPTIRDVLCHLMFNEPSYNAVVHDRNSWSGFATTVTMHAVNIHMWHVLQATQPYAGFSIQNAALSQSMAVTIDEALARCYSFLTAYRAEKDLTPDSEDGPEIFNCQALLRSAYVRISTGAGGFDRVMLLSDSEDEIASRIRSRGLKTLYRKRNR